MDDSWASEVVIACLVYLKTPEEDSETTLSRSNIHFNLR